MATSSPARHGLLRRAALVNCAILLPSLALAANGLQVALAPDGQSVQVAVPTEQGLYYGLERSGDLHNWSTVDTFDGVGGMVTRSVPLNDDTVFFRFVTEQNGDLHAPVDYDFTDSGLQLSGFSYSTARALAGAGIESSDELLNRFRSVYRLNAELERLNSLGVEIDSGGLVNLIREVELRANLQPLYDAGNLDPATLQGLVSTRFSMSELYALLSPLVPRTQAGAPLIMKAEGMSDELDLRSRDTMMELNNRLVEVGSQRMNRGQFRLLRNYVAGLSPASDDVVRGSNQNSLEGRSDISTTPAQNELNTLSQTPEDISYIPQAAKLLNEARVKIQPVPMTIIGTRIEKVGNISLPVDVGPLPPFTNDIEGTNYRSFVVNKPCLAIFRTYGHAAGGSLSIQDGSGNSICEEAIPAQTLKTLIMPIGPKKVCEQFRINKSGSADFRLIAMQQVQSLDNWVNEEGLGAYGIALPTMRGGPAGGAGWYSFHIAVPSEGEVSRTLKITLSDDSESAPARKAILIGPDGDSFELNITPNTRHESDVSLRSGLWQMLILPVNSFSLAETVDNFPYYLPATEAQGVREDNEVTLDIELPFSSVKTRKFVIGTLDTASFMYDGESDGNRAEIKLSLTANIAPYFEQSQSFSSIFGETEEFAAWKLWMENGFKISGISSNATFKTGLAAIKNNGEVPRPGAFNSTPTDQDWMLSYTAYIKDTLGRNWYTHIEGAQTIYNNWVGNIVQINAMKFPMKNRYNIIDSPISGYTMVKTGSGEIAMPVFQSLHPIVPVHLPQFAFPKDRMAEESMTINASYNAVEMDELDKSDLFGAFVKGVVNIGLSLYHGNFAAAACGGIGMIDEMNSTIKAAEDDNIGSANYRLNRSSTMHGFYGLSDGTRNPVTYSGYASKNGDYMLDNALGWAKLACTGYSLFSSSNLLQTGSFNPVDSIQESVAAAKGIINCLNGDLTDIDNLSDLFLTLAGENPEMKDFIEEFFTKVKNGIMDENFEETLQFDDLSAILSGEGSDRWDNFAELLAAVQDMRGVGQLGFNEIHSNAYFPFKPYEVRKTQGRSTVSVVDSVPLRHLRVEIDKVQVFDLQEDFSILNPYAELYMNTRVGVVSDQLPTSWGVVELQYVEDGAIVAENGSKGFKTVGETPFTAYAKKVFNVHIMTEDQVGGLLFPNSMQENSAIINCQWTEATGNNAAAVFVEVGIFEDDGDTCDDDMVGVYSRTFLLEDIVKAGNAQWSKISNDTWRISVTDVPVFSSRWLETEVEIGTYWTEAERKHNIERLEHPAALVSLHVDVTLGEFTEWVDNNDYDIRAIANDDPLAAEVHPVVVASSSGPVLDQIVDFSAPIVLTRRPKAKAAESNLNLLLHYNVLDTWNVDGETPAITHLKQLPPLDWPLSQCAPFHKDNFLYAGLVQGGDYIAVLSEDGLRAYDMRGEAPVLTSYADMSDLYPSRLAVDRLGDLIYVSLRDYSKDLRVFTINGQGQLAIQAWYDDIPRTIAGLVPMPGGGLIVHYVGNMRTDCHKYGDEYMDTFDDIDGWLDERFGNSNGFLRLSRDGALLTKSAYIDIAGDISELQMYPIMYRNQSSMFRLFDDRTIISRNGRYEFALRLDEHDFFRSMSSINYRSEEGFFMSNFTGRMSGALQFAAYTPGRLYGKYIREYRNDEEALSPACVYNGSGMIGLDSTVPLVMSVDMYPISGGSGHLILTATRQSDYKPTYHTFECGRTKNSLSAGFNLAIVDLVAPKTPEPPTMYTIKMQEDYGRGAMSIAWIDSDNLLIGLSSQLSASYTGMTIANISDPENPRLDKWFGDNMGHTHAVAHSGGYYFGTDVTDPCNVICYKVDNKGNMGTAGTFYSVGYAHDLEVHPANGAVISSDSGGYLFVYTPDSAVGWARSTFGGDLGYFKMALSPDGSRIALTSGQGDRWGFSIRDSSAIGTSTPSLGLPRQWSPGDVTLLSAFDNTMGGYAMSCFSPNGNILYLVINKYTYGGIGASSYIVSLDISDPAFITQLGYFELPMWPYDIMAADNYLVLALDDGVHIYDVHNPANATYVDKIPGIDTAFKLALSPNGKWLAVNGENIITIVETP